MPATHKPFSAVLFDLDGTLIDTTQSILESFKHTIFYFTGTVPQEDEIRPYMGLPLTDQFSILLPGKEEEACKIYVEHNTAIHPEYVKAYPGVSETLKILRNSGVRLGLVTSKRRPTAVLGLTIAGIQDSFHATVFYEDTDRHKPHPAPILKTLEIMACNEPDWYSSDNLRILVVGDSPTDIKAAKNAQVALRKFSSNTQQAAILRPEVKIQSAGVTYGAYRKEDVEKEKPDYLITDITQVLDLLGLNQKYDSQ